MSMDMDLDLDSKALAWMREHGKEYGFVEDVPREPWHWTYRGGAVK
jgi:D-alanyl-D-alanine carboxypeptidase